MIMILTNLKINCIDIIIISLTNKYLSNRGVRLMVGRKIINSRVVIDYLQSSYNLLKMGSSDRGSNPLHPTKVTYNLITCNN